MPSIENRSRWVFEGKMETRLHLVYSTDGPFTTQVMSHHVTGSSDHAGQDCWAWFTDAVSTAEFEQDFYERRRCLIISADSQP